LRLLYARTGCADAPSLEVRLGCRRDRRSTSTVGVHVLVLRWCPCAIGAETILPAPPKRSGQWL